MDWNKHRRTASEKINNGIDQAITYLAQIDAPPCKDCLHWRPGLVNSNGTIRFCKGDDMKNDFSCFSVRAGCSGSGTKVTQAHPGTGREPITQPAEHIERETTSGTRGSKTPFIDPPAWPPECQEDAEG